MSNIFNRLELQAFRVGITPRTKESRVWFQKKASNLRSIKRQELMKEDPLTQRTALPKGRALIGTMQMFFYDPKTKDTLPYYDYFPLVIVVGKMKGWILWFESTLSSTRITCKDVRCVDGDWN